VLTLLANQEGWHMRCAAAVHWNGQQKLYLCDNAEIACICGTQPHDDAGSGWRTKPVGFDSGHSLYANSHTLS